MGTPIPILAGIRMDGSPTVRVEYPVNMVPVPGQDGVADGHLRPAEGIQAFATGPGFDRASITLPEGHAVGSLKHFRVSGTKLISVSSAGVVTEIGDVGGSGYARMAYSFDLLGVMSGGKLWFWDDVTLVEVTSPNIPANLVDMCWLAGYWIVTDGTDIAVSDLVTPTTFNATKFGTTDRPSKVKSLKVLLNELYVNSRDFIDVFQNIGGAGFPFARVSSALITKGPVGTPAACVFNDTVAFVGSGINEGKSEAPGVYLAHNARTVKVSTVEIDRLLLTYTEAQLALVAMDAVNDQGGEFLFVHLPDRTVVYDAVMSKAAQQPVWHIRTSAVQGFSQYRGRNIARANGVWVVGDPASTSIGIWSVTDSQHYGLPVRWEFSTFMIRNKNKGATLHSIELLSLTGSVTPGSNPMISTSHSPDGVNFGGISSIRSGQAGQLVKRLVFYKQGSWGRYRIQKFFGDSGSRISVLALDAELSPHAF